MSVLVVICVFDRHVKESVHERISHEHEVKVLEHLDELILTPAVLEIVASDLKLSRLLALLLN